MKSYKEMFPIFKNHPELIYLDSAATCQKPQELMDALSEYYSLYNSNIGRGSYQLADQSYKKYHDSKQTIANFFHTTILNIAITYGATDSLNQAAYFVEQELHHLPTNKKNGYIVISCAEHHSNILPWIRLAQKHHLHIHLTSPEELLDPSLISNEIKEKSIAYVISHVSNVTGEILPIEKWISLSKIYNAYSIIDGSQAVGSFRVFLDKLECDFYAFSAHKMYGPMGIGILYVSNDMLKKETTPIRLGGGIVDDVPTSNINGQTTIKSFSIIKNIEQFEAGTPNVANTYAFAKTIDWMVSIQWFNCIMYMSSLGKYLHSQLKKNGYKILEISPLLDKTHIASFIVPGIHSHDVGTFLAKHHIAVRAGKHCAYPLYDILDINSSNRASIGLYNTHQDIDNLINNLKIARKFFE